MMTTARNRPLRILMADPVYGKGTPFWYVPLGLGYLASFLTARFGDSIQIQIEKEVERILYCIREGAYDVFAATNYVWNSRLSYSLTRRAKLFNPGVLTVQGGPHFDSNDADAALQYFRQRPEVDYYVHGEGERSFAALIQYRIGGGPQPTAGLAYLADEAITIGARPPRIEALDEIPSPYLGGFLDPFLTAGLAPILETNRGCPFSCTFCNWGSATVSHVHQFSLDRVCEEITYIARTVKNNDHLTIADANFGILQRDRDIARHIESTWQKERYPSHIHLWYAKNSSRRIVEIAEILGRKVRFLLAVQSLDSGVLANVKRSNIRSDDYHDLAAYARSKGLLTASDLIVGLPGDSLQTFQNSLRELYRNGSDKVDMFNLILIPDTELATRESRDKFGMVTRYRLSDGCFMKIGQEVIAESEEVVVQTNTFSHEHYELLRFLKAVFVFWNHCGLGEAVNIYARGAGIVESDLFLRVIDKSSMSDGFERSLRFFRELLKNELFSSHEAVLNYVEANYNSLSRVTRLDFLYAFYLIQQRAGECVIDAVLDTLEGMIQERPNGKANLAAGEEIATLRIYTRQFHRAADGGETGRGWLNHDVVGWLEVAGREPLSQYAMKEKELFIFGRDPDILPMEDLGTLNPATCPPDRFNHWFDRIRNVRGYVKIQRSGENRTMSVAGTEE